MATTTPIGHYPYPQGSDPVDVPGDLQRLALAVDAEPGIRRIYATQAELEARWPSAVDGAHAFTLAELSEWVRIGGVWTAVTGGGPAPPDPATALLGWAQVYYGGTFEGWTATISAIDDPYNIVTQASSTSVQIDRPGLYSLNTEIGLTEGTSSLASWWNYTLQSPGTVTLRTWMIGQAWGINNLIYTGPFVAGQSLRWQFESNDPYNNPAAVDPFRLDLFPLTLY